MTIKTVTEVVETIDHPLEDFFGVASNSTEIVKYEQTTELVKHEEYDEKDDEIEKDLQEIFDKAMSGYENIQEAVEDIDPKYAARTHEVANQLLNTALAAVKEKAGLKQQKDKLTVVKNKNTPDNGKTVNNTTYIFDTNTLVKEMRKANSIEGTATVVENKTNDSEEKQ